MLVVADPCDDKHLEECLKLNNQLKLLMDSSPNLLLLLDHDANFVYGNGNLLNLMGLEDSSTLIGRPIRSLYEGFHDVSFVNRNMLRYHRLMSGHENKFTEDDDINWPIGGRRSYRMTFQRIPFQDTGLDRILIIFNDVTDVRIQEAEHRMNDMLRSTLLPCMMWDENGHSLAINKEASHIFGIPEDTAPEDYTRLMLDTHPEFQPDGKNTEELRREFIHEVLTNGFARISIQLRKLDGTPIHFGISAARVLWQPGHRLIVYYHDLTKIKAKEQEAKDAEDRIKLMLDSTPLICILRDDQNHVIDCNQEALNVFGVSDKPEFFGNFSRFYPELQPNGRRSVDMANQILSEVLEKGSVNSFEWVFQTLNGELIPMEVKIVCMRWKDTYRLLSYARDLREQKKMLAELREADERAQIMLDATPLACSLWDREGNMIDCNLETIRSLELTQKSDYFGRFLEMQPEVQPDGEPTAKKALRLLAAAFETGRQQFEWMSRTSHGEPLPVETVLVRVPWKNDYQVAAYSRDLREEKANERKIQESLEENRKLEIQKEAAQAASEARSQFLASMSHEIRTPMNTIIGLLELMRTDNLDSQQTKYLDDVKHMSDVLLKIINDVLDFHKIESGKVEIVPGHFSLSTLYSDLASRHKLFAESKHLTFTSQLSRDLPKSLFGDELRISQVVTNLISNAVKYTQKGYVIFNVDRVVEGGREFVAFSVEDSGIGIEEENFAMLFDKFEQFDRRKNRGIPGTGLGLPIAKHLAEQMGGYIRFQSEYTKGSIFTFLLPLVEGDLNQIEHAEIIDRVIARSDTKVLVVDDNPGNITVAVGLLARHGIVPQTAGDGLQAIEMIQANKYDLVFMDHMMPEMDGIQATSIIRTWKGEYYENLPIIALSANVVAEARKLFFSSGMNDFVSKPINGNDLNRALLRWLPADKIVTKKIDPETVEPQDETGLNIQLQKLTKIEDLSITSGLSRVGGDKKLYLEVLRKFCQDADGDAGALKKFAKNGKWKDYAIRVHAIKSVLATVGNRFLSDWAFRLEEAAMNGDAEKCVKENGNFCGSLLKFQVKLQNTDLMTDSATTSIKRKISSKALKHKLELLLQACNDFQPETAEPLSGELLEVSLAASATVSASMDASLSKVHDLVQAFDYDKAAVMIEDLIRVL
ncbi:MAG: ATP-binding protein [Planctomycetaceae bacterium]|nr:ATP-binding protein [Planctomycetaceae bacterium]